jgi:hypothetical protein
MVLLTDVNITPSLVKTSSDVDDGKVLEAENQLVLFVFRLIVEFLVVPLHSKVAKQAVGPA